MADLSLKKIITTWNTTYVLIRTDSEARVQFRQLLLAVLICFFMAYVVHKVFVAPQIVKIIKLESQLVERGGGENGQDIVVLSSRLASLQKQSDNDQYELEILALKEKFIKEHWLSLANNDNFNRLIFTLVNSAPVNFEKNLLKTSQLARRDHDGFSIYPMSLEGNGEFDRFFQYLQFLESRPEVGFLDEVEVSALPFDDRNQQRLIDFKITIGRLELQHDS